MKAGVFVRCLSHSLFARVGSFDGIVKSLDMSYVDGVDINTVGAFNSVNQHNQSVFQVP